MVRVYVIESISDKTWYTGIALDAEKRLLEHNSGKNRFTKGHRPWKIIFKEDYPGWSEARLREKYLKTFAGKQENPVHGIYDVPKFIQYGFSAFLSF